MHLKLKRILFSLFCVTLSCVVILILQTNTVVIKVWTEKIDKISIIYDNDIIEIKDEKKIIEFTKNFKWQFFYPAMEKVDKKNEYLVEFHKANQVICHIFYDKKNEVFLSTMNLRAINKNAITTLNKCINEEETK